MTQPEAARVERGPITEVKRFALGMADLLERQGFTIAAAELRRLHAENDRLHQINQSHEMKLSVRGYEIQIADLKAQRDALLEALKSTGLFLHHCWCDVQMNDYSFEKLNQQMAVVDAAIKAVEGENT